MCLEIAALAVVAALAVAAASATRRVPRHESSPAVLPGYTRHAFHTAPPLSLAHRPPASPVVFDLAKLAFGTATAALHIRAHDFLRTVSG